MTTPDVLSPSTSSPEVSLANLSPVPADASAQQMTAGSGRKCDALYRLSGQHGSSLRMCVGFLLRTVGWSSSRCFLIWRPKATTCNRLFFQLVPLMPRTDETAYGLWRTPRANDWKGGITGAKGSKRNPSDYFLPDQVNLWPTPNVAGGGNPPSLLIPHGNHFVRRSGK